MSFLKNPCFQLILSRINNIDFSLIAKDSSVILIEDAVVASMQNTKFSDLVSKASKDNKVYVLEPDLLARGLDKSKIIDGVTPPEPKIKIFFPEISYFVYLIAFSKPPMSVL